MAKVLDIESLTKQFTTPEGEPHTVIDIPAFSMQAGEALAMRGTSGSGKTTFLHLIAGILREDAGRIAIQGNEMTHMPESKRDRLRAQLLGYVFQTFNLLQGYTALENVELAMLFGRGIDSQHAEALLRRVGLADRLHYYPRQLSVGQQQRVALARAVANRPCVVLADEPTGNLDAQLAQEALRLLGEICAEENAALLLVSHDEGVLQSFERVVDLATLNRAQSSSDATRAAVGGGA